MKEIKYIFFSLVTLIAASSAAFSSEILKLPATVVGNNYGFTEGPVWVDHKGLWLFTDIPMNKIYSLDTDGTAKVWMEDSGFATKRRKGHHQRNQKAKEEQKDHRIQEKAMYQ